MSQNIPKGRRAFIGNVVDLNAAAEWARAFCHLALGPIEGEAHYRKLKAVNVLSLWARKGQLES